MKSKLIAVVVTLVTLGFACIALYGKTQQSDSMDALTHHVVISEAAGRRNLATGIHLMMGGEVAMGDDLWNDIVDDKLYESSPFIPRQYTGIGTAHIHYKYATEQDAEGETTFPPSKSPIAQYTGWFSPTASPSRVPVLSPSWGLSTEPTFTPLRPTRNPTRFPTKLPSHEKFDSIQSPEPTKVPTRAPSKGPSKLPTRAPSKNPSFGPTRVPSRGPTRVPSRGPTRVPSRGPTRDPSRGPTRDPSRGPTRDPSRGPTRDPSRGPTRDPSAGPSRGPTRGPTRSPVRGPSGTPSRGQFHDPTQGPAFASDSAPKSSSSPTLKPILLYGSSADSTLVPTGRQNNGNFFCGSSVLEAGKCETPCPNGISDCATGFCYAVAECLGQFDHTSNTQPTTNELTPTQHPLSKPDVTRQPSLKPGETPQPMANSHPPSLPLSELILHPTAAPRIEGSGHQTKEPSNSIKPYSSEFFCASSLLEASSSCNHACPTGSPMECPGNLKCYATSGCVDGPILSPDHSPPDPSASFYCGSSFQMASEQCLVPCPSGVSADCPPSQGCYANTPCEDKKGFFCGTSIVNASATCGFSCPSGLDSDCPIGLSCYETLTCKSYGGTMLPDDGLSSPDVEEGTKYCGYSYEHASTTCMQSCPSGLSKECPQGMSCFAHTPCEELDSFYCGVSWNNAASSCQYPCPSGADDDCPPNTHCYAYTKCDETDSSMCGTSFEDASSSCDKPCPSGSPADCPPALSCFTHTTCPAQAETNETMVPPTPAYIPGDSFYCGKSFFEASSKCTDACPTRLDSECPYGEQCFGNTPCPTRKTYYCGANLDEASAICEHPCPSGDSEDCPNGLSCFAFTTCADKNSFYCGANFIEADSNCGTPCPSGLSSDCPENLTCFAHTTCAIEPMSEPSGPLGSYFCGESFDEATRDCSLPCPSGSDADCPQGMNCFSHTSCTDRDSFMCGYSWDHASGTCSNPCPSGERSDCPDGMSCFAYTPCNNAGSFFCGSSFDEASNCDHPCPSGNSDECPENLSCFSYTSCGTGDFNAKSPTQLPTLPEWVPIDSFYCGTSFTDASTSCEYHCPNGSSDCPTGLACFEFTSCVGRETPSFPPTGERDSFFCGRNYTDANEKCLDPCPGGSSLECPPDESCIPFTSCHQHTDPIAPPTAVVGTFYCGSSKEDAEASCSYPCPFGSSDCPDGLNCYSFTSCAPGFDSTTSSPVSQSNMPNSFYCGSSFENATSSCSLPCSSGSSAECPVGQSCYGFTSCSDRDSFYCGRSWDEAASSCTKPCPTGDNDECANGEVCFGYTPCNTPETDIPVESFYCGASFEEASALCNKPCPSGKHSECPDGELCHPHTPCGEQDSFFCGSSWVDAATSCLIPCPSGSSANCPEDQFCFPSTPCDEVDSFFCGINFEDATSSCNMPCKSGLSSDCPDNLGCFAYTLCNEYGLNSVPSPTLAPIPVAPPDSFYCGTSFNDASTVCERPCPSGLSEDCPGESLCFASTPCSDRGSFFCGRTWEDASTTCTDNCPSGLSSDCPTGQFCFGYTPCTKSESFYCGISFEEASASCTDACPSGHDSDCPGQETCHKYTPCNDISPISSIEPNVLPFPVDSFYCGHDFVDASMNCYLPCPSGSAAECPVGEACYGNTPCGGEDSFFCGVTWYDASSKCKVPCPSGLDGDCPDNLKCFGYTPCTNTNSFYCGADFFDASTTCIKPCPSGSSSECPSDLACFPNTPCGNFPPLTSKPVTMFTSSPAEMQLTNVVTGGPTLSPINVPSQLPTLTPSQAIVDMKSAATYAPHISMFLYCGSDVESTECSLPCPNGDECPLGYECYATPKCSDSFFCGDSFDMANSTCVHACPDGRDDSCPLEMNCYAQTSCASPSTQHQDSVSVGSFYCGLDYTDAATSCPLACPSGSSEECLNLGSGYSCFANTPCDDRDSYYCGTSWSHASSNCLFPCPTGGDNECPDKTFCFPYTSCSSNDSFMCGTSFEHASSCERPCPSGSSSECPFGESCFTHTTCAVTKMVTEPTASPHLSPPDDSYLPGNSFYCGTSFLDASTLCTKPCPTRLDSECPEGQQCFGNTPCYNRETYFCGTSIEEASGSCEYPCPTGRSNECPENLSCFAFTTCADKGSYFCGNDYIDASSKCSVPCESGLSSDCPDNLTCFAFTSCHSDGPGVANSAFCGESFEIASQECTKPCTSSNDCTPGEACFPFATCQASQTNYPAESFYCGTTFEEASVTCSRACPSGDHGECPSSQFCFPNTPCHDHSTYFCGTSWTDAATSCLIPCPSGSSAECPIGNSCFPSTPCDKSNSFFCGSTFEDATTACSIPCPRGHSNQCPSGQGCFAYTLCNEVGKSGQATPTLAPIPDVPPDSFYCGSSFDDATSTCGHPCVSGLSTDCPGDLLCFAGTSCNAAGSFFCGKSWEDAASTCNLPCTSGLNSDCPLGELCFGYTPCMNDDTFFCGLNFDDASKGCTDPCPSGSDKECAGLETCHKYTSCADGVPSLQVEETLAPDDSYFCGMNFNDASVSCAIPCPSHSSTECPVGQACYSHTTCSKMHPETFFCGSTISEASRTCALPCPTGKVSDCPSDTSCFAYTSCATIPEEMATPESFESPVEFNTSPVESYYCGTSFKDASAQCDQPCPTKLSSDCPLGMQCFSHTTCLGTQPTSYFCGVSFDDASSTCAVPCTSGSLNECPSGQNCYAYTTCTTFEASPPTHSPLDNGETLDNLSVVPAESYFCGLSYEDASDECFSPCPNRDNSECPGIQQCYAYTPCANPETFFCGKSIDDANEMCAIPCPTGRSDTCPLGESCYAYTTCEPFAGSLLQDMTADPTKIPSTKPTRQPTMFPTESPSNKPTINPTSEPSNKPSSVPTTHPSSTPTEVPTKNPTRKPTSQPTGHPSKTPTYSPTMRPTFYPTDSPSEKPTKLPSKYPTRLPTKSPILVPMLVKVPKDSFYCGVTFYHASELCGFSCPNGNNDECPPGLMCYGNTPCGDKKSFFCGVSYEDANDTCSKPCPKGSADECPSGQSCFAYTECRLVTNEPTQNPTEMPSFSPTSEPTNEPSSNPTMAPSHISISGNAVTEEGTKEVDSILPQEKGESQNISPQDTVEEDDESDNTPQDMVEEEDEGSDSTPQVEDTMTEKKEEIPDESANDESDNTPQDMVEEEEEDEESDSTPQVEDTMTEKKEEIPDESANFLELVKPCEDPLAMTVNQGYWRSWSSDRPETCNKFEASDIDGTTYTHLVYSFASISSDGHMEPWVGSWDEVDKYKEFNKVKDRNPNIKTLIAVTEGIFYGAGMNPVTFHEVAETFATRLAFAQSVISFLELYGFDGIDIDWESPLDPDKGGGPENFERFVLLVEEIRSAFQKSGKDFILTVALPPTDWELYDYDLVGLSKFVDWFNLMSFDYHTPKNIPKTVGAHSDLKLISSVVTELVKVFAPTKLVLGMSAYGRTYTLVDEECKELGCPFRSPGLGGCSNTPGFLPFNEIRDYIYSESYDELHQDVSSSSMVAVLDGDQMISFDDESTWAIKETYAESLCLRGTMLWSVDMIKPQTFFTGRFEGGTDRTLLTTRSSSNQCSLCSSTQVPSSTTFQHEGEAVSCADIQMLLETNIVPRQSDQCLSIISMFSKHCCIEPHLKSCDICSSVGEIMESQKVLYSGILMTCGDVSSSLLNLTKENSSTCSIARASLVNHCCIDYCNVCPNAENTNLEGVIYHENRKLSCAEYQLVLKSSNVLEGSDECTSLVSPYLDTCCVKEAESVRTSPELSNTQCNICQMNNIHHELKSESMVEYKGTHLSCLDLNSILSKNEDQQSELCVSSQAALFDGCCYKKCSLCNEKLLAWDRTVRYNNQILSCEELDSMFTLGSVTEDSDLCDVMRSAYSSICCFRRPRDKCNLCEEPSLTSVNTHSFVKTRSSSKHCMDIVNSLAEREEQGSEVCNATRQAFSKTCCTVSSLSADSYYYDWLSDSLSSSTSGTAKACNFFRWFVVASLLLLAIVGHDLLQI